MPPRGLTKPKLNKQRSKSGETKTKAKPRRSAAGKTARKKSPGARRSKR